MSNLTLLEHLVSTIAPSLEHNNSSGVSEHGHGHTHGNHTLTAEGGFLSGRNPFIFVASTPLPTFIIQLLLIVCMSRLIKLFLTPLKQPGKVC